MLNMPNIYTLQGLHNCFVCGKIISKRKICKRCKKLWRKGRKNTSKKSKKKPNKLLDLGFKNYDDFLYSELWQKTKSKFFNWRLRQGKHQSCEFCNSINYLVVHHMTYVRVGNERMEDLLLICRDCHTGVHELHKKIGGRLKKATLLFGKIKNTTH